MQAIQNLGLAVITIVAGVIVDTSGYLILEVFFLANLCVALIAGETHCLNFMSIIIMGIAMLGNIRVEVDQNSRLENTLV